MKEQVATVATSIRPLERRIGYAFRDRTLIQKALSVPGKSNIVDYEVLEFFGDAALRYVVPKLLVERYSKIAQSDLARMSGLVTCNATLAHLAVRIGCHRYLNFGLSRPAYHLKLMADVFEAIIGAIDAEAGAETVLVVCRRLFKLNIELARFDHPMDQLLALTANSGKGRITYQVYPIAGGKKLEGYVAVVKQGKETIAKGEGIRAEWATHNAAAIALLKLFSGRFPCRVASFAWKIKQRKLND